MAGRLCFSCWFLVCCLVVTGSEGQEVTPPGGSQNNGDSTDCQIFTLTPPPTTRSLVTKIQPITRTPKCPFHFFTRRKPRIHFRFPHRPFFPPKCKHRFQKRPVVWPLGRHTSHYQYFPRRYLQRESSSSEES